MLGIVLCPLNTLSYFINIIRRWQGEKKCTSSERGSNIFGDRTFLLVKGWYWVGRIESWDTTKTISINSILSKIRVLHLFSYCFFFKQLMYLFGCTRSYCWLQDVQSLQCVESSSLTVDWTKSPCVRSFES